MSERSFHQAGLDALEGRLAPAAIVPTAHVAQTGQYEGQFGDQTTPDAPGVREGRAEDGPETVIRPFALTGTAAVAQAPRPGAVLHPAGSTATHVNFFHSTGVHTPVAAARPLPAAMTHFGGFRHR